MSKTVTSISLDEDLAERFANDDSLNLSGTANKLLREYLQGNRGEISMLELREGQLKSEIQSLEGDLENKREELDAVQERLEEARDEKNSKKAVKRETWFQKVRMVDRDPEHSLVQEAAEELEMSPGEVLDEAYDDDDGRRGGSP